MPLRIERMVLVAMKSKPRRMPGSIAAMNISGTDSPMVVAYTIIAMLGGMMGPREPPAASRPAASVLE